jgi:hypothetical protein
MILRLKDLEDRLSYQIRKVQLSLRLRDLILNEVGVVVGKSKNIRQSIKTKETEDYVFGLVLLNDWSVRDFQTWEYVSLLPFNAKNFATTISPWIVALEALKPFEVELPKQDPTSLKCLQEEKLKSWNIPISVLIKQEPLMEVYWELLILSICVGLLINKLLIILFQVAN